MRKLLVCALTGLLFASASCATLLKGRTEEITVITDPPGAKVTVNDNNEGASPVTFTVPSKENLDVHLEKDGYASQDLNEPAKFRWGYEAFSFISYVIPVFIDLGTGAAWGHDKLTMTTHLEPSANDHSAAASAPSPAAEPSPTATVPPAKTSDLSARSSSAANPAQTARDPEPANH